MRLFRPTYKTNAFRRLGFLFMLMLPFAAMALPLLAGAPGRDFSLMVKKTAGMTVGRIVGMGDKEKAKGHDDKALVLYLVACNRPREGMDENDRRQCGIAHLRAGNVYYSFGRYAGALDYYVGGLKIYESCSDQSEIGRFYNNIGSVYCTFQEFEKGLGYYEKGLECCRKYHDRTNEYKLLVNMAGVCAMTGRTAEARRYWAASEKLRDRRDREKTFMSGYNKALILVAEKRYAEAITQLRKQVAYGTRYKMAPQYVCSAYQQIYRAFLQVDRKDSAIVYMGRLMATAERNGILHKFVDLFKDYSDIYESEGNIARSQDFLSRYVTLKDSIYNMREFDIAKNAQFLYEVGKTERAIADYHAKETAHRNTIRTQRIIVVGALLVALVIGLFLFVVMRQKRKIDRSYSDLFLVNRNSVATIGQMKERLRVLNEKLKELSGDMERTAPAAGEEGSDGAEKNAAGTIHKYHSSNLNEEQQSALAESVVGVMENTDEFCHPDFSLDRLAGLVGSNSKYVSQVINDTFHKNFSNFVNEYRIREACARLTDTRRYGNFTIRAIAEGVGFRSHSVFISVFKRMTGLTPSMYQDKARADGGE